MDIAKEAEFKLIQVSEMTRDLLKLIRQCRCPECGLQADLLQISTAHISYLCRHCNFGWEMDIVE